MQVTHKSENPVLVGGDYKRAALFFDEVVPVMWPGAESEEGTLIDIERYGEYRDALEAPCLKDHLLHSQWRGWVEGYAHLAIARFVFLKIRRDHPEATNIWQLADRALDYLRHDMPGVDPGYLSIFFPDSDTLWRRVVADPLEGVVDALAQGKTKVDTYGHPGHDDTDDSIDVILSNLDIVQCDALSWEHISEIRKDPAAIEDLRRLRKFILRDMRNFPKSYVEDELLKAIDTHRQAAKTWGLTTQPSSIRVDCEASMVAGMLIAVGALATGAVVPVLSAVGVMVPLGQALFSIYKGRKALIRDSNVRYLVRLQDASAEQQ